MAGSARWAVVGLVSLLVVLGLTPSVVEAILLDVDYPADGNYSYVTLTCKKDRIIVLSSDQQPATFWRGTSQITSESQLVTLVLAETDVSISFVFNQTQEGSFSCKTALDEVSNVEALAASPYITPMMPQYILFPSLDHTRKVNLSCAIQPGALTANYRVAWSRVKPTPIFYSDDTFNITVTETTEMSSTPSEYQCIVTIDHSSMDDEEYKLPIIVVKKKVLSALSGEIGDVSVAAGERATFVCNALKRDTNFSISWKVDGETFNCGGTDTSSDNIHCYMDNETASVLQIENTAALDVGSHAVQCILENDVLGNFREDCVSLPRGSCNVTKNATLRISSSPTPTVTGTMPTVNLPPMTSSGPVLPSNGPTVTGSIVGVAAGVAGGALVALALVAAVVLLVLCYCCCIRGNRRNNWYPNRGKLRRQKKMEEGIEMVPPDPHVSPNKQFHGEGTPLFKRQNANQPNRPHNLDVEDIYNGGSMMSGHSGMSGLSEDNSTSCPPSPNVSSCLEEDDDDRAHYNQGEESGYQGRGAPSISITNEALQFNLEPTGERDGYVHEQPYQQIGNLSHAPSSSHAGLSQTSYTGIPNLLSQSDHPYNGSYQPDPTLSLWVPNYSGSNHSMHSEPITIGHGAPGSHSQTLGPQSEYRGHSSSPRVSRDDRRHQKHSPSSRHSDQSDRQSEHHSGYHSDYIDDPHHHHHNYHHRHHDEQNHRHRSNSRSRSRSPKYPNHLGQTTPPSLRSEKAHQYLSHRTLPNKGRTAFQTGAAPMRQSRSDDLGPQRYYLQERAPRSESKSNLSDTESWVASTQRLHHTTEAHPPPPPQSHPSHSSHSSHSTSGSDPIKESPPGPPGEGPPQIMDRILLEAVGCLMHQENCRIARCPCRDVKKRFQHIIPQSRLHIQQEALRLTEDVQSGRFDPSDRRQQMRLSLSSQNFSPEIHAHYHMTSRSHIRQSVGAGMNRLKFMQRRRSKSMDLTPVMEQPGESCATTPGVIVPDMARALLCGPTFSPAITPSGETLRVLSPTTPSSGQVVPPVLLREISLSADNLPALCLNDCPMAATPLMHLGNRPLGSALRTSPLSTNQQRWAQTNQQRTGEQKDSPSSDEDQSTSQDSSSSIHTTSTQSSSGHSGKTDGTSVFDNSALPNRSFGEQVSTSMSGSNPETSLRRKDFRVKGKQEEIEVSQQGSRPAQYQHLESGSSGYSTTSDATDPETSLSRSQRPGDLPISPLTPKKAPPPSTVAAASSREPSVHLIPNGRQRRGSTSSHSSHHSHVSQHSDGSTVTETLC